VEIDRVPPLLGAHYLSTACEDRTGALWLGTRSQGVYRVTPGRHEPVRTSSDDIRALFEDEEGTIWAGTNSSGLNAISPRFHRLRDKTSGLRSDGCFAVCVDEAGALWYANGDGGWRGNGTDGSPFWTHAPRRRPSAPSRCLQLVEAACG